MVWWEAAVVLLLLLLKGRDPAPDTIFCPLEPCRAHQKYNEQCLKKPHGPKQVWESGGQLQVKGICQSKCTMDANQAAKHTLLQKANVNLQGHNSPRNKA